MESLREFLTELELICFDCGGDSHLINIDDGISLCENCRDDEPVELCE